MGKRIGKWDCIKLKSFCLAKETVPRLKRQPLEWEHIFASYTAHKGLIPGIYRKLKESTTHWKNGQMH
jgi:hypothetical protein